MQAETISSSVPFEYKPFCFYRADEIPKHFCKQVEVAVKDFVESSRQVNIDKKGLFYQTLESIANMTVLEGSGDFWMLTCGEELLGYVLARIVKDVDNSLTYWISQAWVRKDYRGNSIVKASWKEIRERAKNCFCKHIVIVSSRHAKAYERFLGVHKYCDLLKEDL